MLRYLASTVSRDAVSGDIILQQALKPRDTFVSAASPSQIKFAEENKYDDTGPGAKKPDYAYSTYKTLEEALVAYLDDPDTKLPDHEREKAIQKLLNTQSYSKPRISGYYSKAFKGPAYVQQGYVGQGFYAQSPRKPFYQTASRTASVAVDRGHYSPNDEKNPETFRFQKVQIVKGSPLNIAHYTRYPELSGSLPEHSSYPQYVYSYGVHDKATGDVKQVAESRAGGNVQGFYSYIDANGKPHTVHYTANGAKGFRAAVTKVPVTY